MPSRKVVSGDTPTGTPRLSVYTVTVNFTLQRRPGSPDPATAGVRAESAAKALSQAGRRGQLSLTTEGTVPQGGTTQRSAGMGRSSKESRGRTRLWGSDDNMREGLLEAKALL